MITTVRDPVFGCLIATGRPHHGGYVYDGKQLAHVVAWERVHGPRPIDKTTGQVMQCEHTCRERRCVAIQHLEIVTKRENELRKSWAYRAARKTCAKGHDLQRHRVVTRWMGIVCRLCNQEALGAHAIEGGGE